METQQMIVMMPGLEPEELITLQNIMNDMSESQQRQFVSLYSGKRKDRQTLLIMALIGFLGVAGIHRFVIGQVGMGIIYFLTGGFCGIGTIIDIVNIKSIANTYNYQQAIESAGMTKMMTK